MFGKNNFFINSPYLSKQINKNITKVRKTFNELKIETYPSRLFAKETGEVKFRFRPNPEKIESHNSTWGFEIVVG